MDQNCTEFLYLKKIFPWASDTKIKEGIIVGLQM
jgi:hypothetical protein